MAERDRDDVRNVVSVKSGRRLLLKVLEQTGVFKLSYTGEAISTAFNEGQRNIGIWFRALIEDADPKAIPTMMEEQKKESDAYARRSET